MNLAASLLFHKHNINLNVVFRLVEPQKTDYYQENFGVDIAFKDGLIDVTFNTCLPIIFFVDKALLFLWSMFSVVDTVSPNHIVTTFHPMKTSLKTPQIVIR